MITRKKTQEYLDQMEMIRLIRWILSQNIIVNDYQVRKKIKIKLKGAQRNISYLQGTTEKRVGNVGFEGLFFWRRIASEVRGIRNYMDAAVRYDWTVEDFKSINPNVLTYLQGLLSEIK